MVLWKDSSYSACLAPKEKASKPDALRQTDRGGKASIIALFIVWHNAGNGVKGAKMNSETKNSLYYLESHEWVLFDGDTATIGVSDHVQKMLSNIAYLELPDAGRKFNAGDVFGVIESTKMATDLYIPISGTVLEKNEAAEADPGLVNRDAYEAWLIRVHVHDASEAENLMTAEEYEKRASE